MTTPGMGFYERIWRERCGYAAFGDEAIDAPDVWEASGEVPVLLYPKDWKRDPVLRELVFAAASAILYRHRYGDEATARAIANHPVLAHAVASVRDEDRAAD